MAQNTSSAVMQQRAHDAPDQLEFFPTPPWATRALCEFLQGEGLCLGLSDAWEPTCGELHMVKPLREYFGHVKASDVHQYGDNQLCDFLLTGPSLSMRDWVIMNPPFKPAAQFLSVAMDRARSGVAMLLRTSWSEGAERYREIFEPHPPAYELQFSQRVVMLQGRLIQEGAKDPFNLDPATGLPRKASSATSYAWFIWLRDDYTRAWLTDTRKRWVAPIRKALERAGDYPDYSAEIAEVEARARALAEADQSALFT